MAGMKETATTKPDARSTHGVVQGAAHLAFAVVERGQTTTIAVLQGARVELKVVFDHGLKLAEKTAASLFRFARKLGERLDQGVAETLGNADRYLSGAVTSARETTKAATDLAHAAGTVIAGQTASA
jgi:hypothetical protein